jgi:predicted metal-dependent RNase
MMKILFLGGAAEVGASCVLVEFGARRILFDCGMRMKGDDSLPDLELVQRAGGLDAIVVSHAHMDHTGSLPVISDAYPQAPIYMTAPTLAITRVLLNDSLKIMSQEAELPTFNRRQVEQTLERVVTVPLQDPRGVFADEGLELQFFQAGHILGAAMVWVTSKAGSFFYTGDVSVSGQKTVGGLSIPARLRPDACVVESTYGARLHASRERELARMLEMVGSALEQGGKVLIPAFAVGRAQEVILLLRSALANGRIPAARVYVDGMVREVCRIYKEYPNYCASRWRSGSGRGRTFSLTKRCAAWKRRNSAHSCWRRMNPA